MCTKASVARPNSRRSKAAGRSAGRSRRPQAGLQVRSRVRQVQRLVAQREVGDDVARAELAEQRPVAERRVADDGAVDDAVASSGPSRGSAPASLRPSRAPSPSPDAHGARRSAPLARPRQLAAAAATGRANRPSRPPAACTRAKTSPSVRVRPLNDSSRVGRVRVVAPGVAIDARMRARPRPSRRTPTPPRASARRSSRGGRAACPSRAPGGRAPTPPSTPRRRCARASVSCAVVSGAATPPGTTRPRKNRLPNSRADSRRSRSTMRKPLAAITV